MKTSKGQLIYITILSFVIAVFISCPIYAKGVSDKYTIWYCSGERTDNPTQGLLSADVGIKNNSEASAEVEIFLAVYDSKNCLVDLSAQRRILKPGESCVAATQSVELGDGQNAALYVLNDTQPVGDNGKISLFVPTDDAVSAAYRQIDREFVNVFDWLVELYDPKTGGFYTTVSGARYEGFVPSLESTAFVCQMMTQGESGAISAMPPEMKQKLTDFFLSRQDIDGFFYDDGFGSADYTARDKIRLYGQCVDALNVLGSKPIYTPNYNASQYLLQSAAQSNAADGLPDYCSSVDSFIAYISALNWDNNSWEAGDLAYEAMSYALLRDDSEEYKTALLEFLEERQDNVTGYWGKSGDYGFNACSGAFKVSMIYNRFSMCPIQPEKILESVAKTLGGDDFPTAACYVRNPISIIQLVDKYRPDLVKKIYSDKEKEMAEQYQRYISLFFHSDGGASSDAYRAKTKFGGIPCGLGLCEGDIDGTRQMWIARKDLYHIFGREPDSSLYKPSYDEFWSKLLNKPYIPKRTAKSILNYTEDFKKISDMEELYNNNWSSVGLGAALAVKNGNRFLKLSDTSLSAAENLKLNFLSDSISGNLSCRLRFERTADYSERQSDLSYTYMALSGSGGSLTEVHAIDKGNNTVSLNVVYDYDASGGNKYKKLTDVPIGSWIDLSISYKKQGSRWKIGYTVNGIEYETAADMYTNRSISGVNCLELVTSRQRTSVICIDDINITENSGA